MSTQSQSETRDEDSTSLMVQRRRQPVPVFPQTHRQHAVSSPKTDLPLRYPIAVPFQPNSGGRRVKSDWFRSISPVKMLNARITSAFQWKTIELKPFQIVKVWVPSRCLLQEDMSPCWGLLVKGGKQNDRDDKQSNSLTTVFLACNAPLGSFGQSPIILFN